MAVQEKKRVLTAISIQTCSNSQLTQTVLCDSGQRERVTRAGAQFFVGVQPQPRAYCLPRAVESPVGAVT